MEVLPGHVAEAEHRQTADEVAEGKVLFGREVAVHELIREEHRHDRGNGKGDDEPPLLPIVEAEPIGPEVVEALRQPSAPDEELEEHHHGELVADRGIHRGGS